MLHIISISNGRVSFQLRGTKLKNQKSKTFKLKYSFKKKKKGLEFGGTYCQQREVEAIHDALEPKDNIRKAQLTALKHRSVE